MPGVFRVTVISRQGQTQAMAIDRWNPVEPPAELGMVAHGPALLARSPGIAIRLRCVFAHPAGLRLLVVLRAVGVQAEAAGRNTSDVSIVVAANGRTGPALPITQPGSWNADHFDLDLDVWIPELPEDSQLSITCSWPQAGLAEQTVTLTLADLATTANHVIALP